MKIYKIKLSTSDYGWTCLSRKAADDQMDELLNTALLHDEKSIVQVSCEVYELVFSHGTVLSSADMSAEEKRKRADSVIGL